MTALIRALRFDEPLVVVLFAIVLAMPLSILAAGDNVLRPDVTITQQVQGVDVPGTGSTVAFLNELGSMPGLFAIAAAVAALLVYSGRRSDALFAIAPVAVAQLANAALKLTFASPRPTSDLVNVTHSGSGLGLGFPSGHTMTTVVLAGSLAYILLRDVDCRWRRGLTIVIGAAVALGMGFSRIYIGAHWPSDVLGAYLWGAAFTALMILAYQYRRPRGEHHAAR